MATIVVKSRLNCFFFLSLIVVAVLLLQLEVKAHSRGLN